MLRLGLLLIVCTAAASAQTHVLIWDEQQPEQKQAYENFLGTEIARYLEKQGGFEVRSVKLDDRDQGLSDENLQWAKVLIWWGHRRHDKVPLAKAQQIVERIKNGQLSLIALHAAHWSAPFMEAMFERTRQDARMRYPDPSTQFTFVLPPVKMPPTYDSIVTPAYYAFHSKSTVARVRVDLPNCVFPGVRADGKPSRVQVLKPEHPIVKGVPASFNVTQTEMYNEPFHVPPPDEVVLEERWAPGEWFRSGMVWNIGKGKVFYFRPGHETYPVFKEKYPLLIVENAARWLGQ